jgi:hypothetical protein
MNRKLILFAGFLVTALVTVANATPVTFNLGTGGSGTVYDASNPIAGYAVPPQGGQAITIYGATVSNNPNGNSPNDGGPGAFTGVLPVFSVTSGSGGNIASGLAPYVSSQGGYTSQLGVTEYDVLVLDLSQVTAGSTLQFTMTEGDKNESFNVWTGTANTTTNYATGLGTSTSFSTGANPLKNEVITGQQVNTNPTFTLTAASNEWIAIQADCQYLLLDTIKVTPPGAVPEPSFYAVFAAGLIGLAVVVRRRRLQASQQATEAVEE